MNERAIEPTGYSANAVTAELVCTPNGWMYTEGEKAAIVKNVYCFYRVAGLNPCTPNQIKAFVNGEEQTDGGWYKDYVVDEDGQATMTAACSASQSRNAIVLQFNRNARGPVRAGIGAVTANLTCVDGNWEYVESRIRTKVTEIDCFGA